MPAMTKAIPGATRTAFETESRCNGSQIDAHRKGHNMQNQTTQGSKSPNLDGIDVGTRVMATRDSWAGRCGAVRSIEHVPARYDDAGAEVLPARAIVLVDFDGSAVGVAFIANGDEPLHLAPTAPPIECASWCEDGDGHPDVRFADDQVCQSKEMVTRPARRSTGSPRAGFVTYSVVARHDPNEAPEVVLWEVENDIEQAFTPTEARTLAASLLAAACLAEDVTLDMSAVTSAAGVFQ